MAATPQWLIYSREHNAWWRAGHLGYTADVREAGRYTAAEAQAILDQANLQPAPDGGVNEFAVPAVGVWPGPRHQPEDALVPHGTIWR